MLKKWIKNKVEDYLVKKLLRSIKEEDILRVSEKGGIICRGKDLTREQIDAIKAEAEYLESSITLKLVLDDMEYLAQKTMFDRSQSFDDMRFGKAQLYVIDILRKKIKNLAK